MQLLKTGQRWLLAIALIAILAGCSAGSGDPAAPPVARTPPVAPLPATPPRSPTAPAPTPTAIPTPSPTPLPEPTATATPAPRPALAVSATPEPRPLVFPDDDAPHRDPREWWYYNGHLSDDLGRKYGFHFVVFHVRQPGFPPVFLSQMGVTDVTDSNYAEGGAAFLVSGAKDGEQLAVTGAGWRLAIGNGTHALEGKIDGTSLSITLRPRKPPALHNKIGWLSGPKGWTYYYSYTRMEASGTLVIDGREVAVSGKAWMDHQWGDFDLPSFPSGWQWFALQLDDGADLMITEPRDDRGNVGPLYGTLVAPDGETRALVETADGISLDVLGSWTSSRTGAEYPAAWRLKVDSAGLDLDLQPVVANQEVPFAGPLPAYWEGKVTVTGTRGGAEISGDGYAELTGYAIRSARQPGAQ